MADRPLDIETFLSRANKRLDVFGLDALLAAEPKVLDHIYNVVVAGDGIRVNLYYESDAELYSLALLEGVATSEVDSRYFLKTQKKERAVGANRENSIYA